MTNYQIKEKAKEFLKPNWEKTIKVVVITFLLSLLSEIIHKNITLKINPELGSVVSIIFSIILIPINYGLISFFLKLIRNEEVYDKIIFSGYKNFGKIVSLEILIGILVFLWSLLLIIPGIIKSLSYSMSPYILHDNPELTISEVMKLSEEIMDGRKAEFFILQLSFIGWILLSILTFGLLLLWVMPYMQTSYAYFYEESLRIYKNKKDNVVFQ